MLRWICEYNLKEKGIVWYSRVKHSIRHTIWVGHFKDETNSVITLKDNG